MVDDFGRWFGDDATLDARPGGRVNSGTRVGHVTLFEEGRALGWEWSRDGDPGWTEVRIGLEGRGDRTRVTVVEVLHEWEHERYSAIEIDGPRTRGAMAMSR